MATLTTAQKTYIWTNSGDTGSTPYNSSDYLQYLYDNQAGEDLDSTVYYALLALRARFTFMTNNSNQRTGDSKSYNAVPDSLDKMIDRWGKLTGLGYTSATIGTINLGIDEEDSEFNIT